MIQRWNVKAEIEYSDKAIIVARGDTEEEALKNAWEYKGVTKVLSIEKRITEKSFPQPPSNLVGVHYRPLKR